MNDINENQKLSFDSRTAVVSTSHALRLGMPKGLGQKVVFFAGDTVVGCEFAKNDAHAQELLAHAQKEHGQLRLTHHLVQPRISPRALRGSNGRSKSYAPTQDKSGKAGKANDADKNKK